MLRDLVPLLMVAAASAITLGMVPPILPLIRMEWSLSRVESGLVNSVFAVGRLAGSFPASVLRHYVGMRLTMAVGTAALLAGTLLCSSASLFPVFLAGRLAMGIGFATVLLTALAEILDRTPLRWRGRAAYSLDATTILSEGLGTLLAGAVAVHGWRAVFLGVVPLLLVSATALGTLGGAALVATGAPPESSRRPEGLVPVYVAALALAMFASGVVYTLVPVLGHGSYGLSAQELSWAMGSGYVAELLGLLVISLVIDRARRERLFLTGALVGGVGCALIAWSGPIPLFVVGVTLACASLAVWMVPAAVLVDRAGVPLPGASLAVYRTVADAGMIIGPLLLGGLAEAADERTAAAVAGFVFVAGAVVLFRGRRCGARGRNHGPAPGGT